MTSQRSPWRYEFNRHSDHNGFQAYDREATLSLCPSFDELVQRIKKEIHQIEFMIEPGQADALKQKQCQRACWHFDIQRETFDQFFNGVNGLRAQYYEGSDFGIAMNQLLVLQLSDALLAHAQGMPTFSLDLCEQSLLHLWTRVWIVEAHAHWDHEVDIINDWVPHPEYGAIGKEAPSGHRLLVNGAWIDQHGDAFLYSKKKCRSHDLYRYGFS